jgi:hypothetical protein
MTGGGFHLYSWAEGSCSARDDGIPGRYSAACQIRAFQSRHQPPKLSTEYYIASFLEAFRLRLTLGQA